jgi:CRISPR-associated endoribonuclease Cas6
MYLFLSIALKTINRLMRLRIQFKHPSKIILPWDYQYPVQEWIYRTISAADQELSAMVHDQGYAHAGKKAFKLFSFGRWDGKPFTPIGRKGMKLYSDTSFIDISFLLPEALTAFVSGLFLNQEHTFYFEGRYSIPVVTVGVEVLTGPAFKNGPMEYSVQTGVRISVGEEGKEHPQYVGPEYEGYELRFLRNLLNKYEAAPLPAKRELSLDEMQLLIHPDISSQMFNIYKNQQWTKMKGYKYDFMLDASESIHRTLYYAGAGEECSMGMGWVERI